jgi:hypothetical protein
MLSGYTQAVNKLGLGRVDSGNILSRLGPLDCCEIVFGLLLQPIITATQSAYRCNVFGVVYR